MGHSFAVSSVSLIIHLFILLIALIGKGLLFLGKKLQPLLVGGRFVLTALNVKGQLVVTILRDKATRKRA